MSFGMLALITHVDSSRKQGVGGRVKLAKRRLQLDGMMCAESLSLWRRRESVGVVKFYSQKGISCQMVPSAVRLTLDPRQERGPE